MDPSLASTRQLHLFSFRMILCTPCSGANRSDAYGPENVMAMPTNSVGGESSSVAGSSGRCRLYADRPGVSYQKTSIEHPQARPAETYADASGTTARWWPTMPISARCGLV